LRYSNGREVHADGLGNCQNTAIWIAAAGLLAFAFAALLDRHVFGHTNPLFWDLPVYLRAVDLLAAGQNPYDSELLHGAGVSSFLYFISPPAVTMMFAAIAKSPLRPLFEPALILLHFCAMAGTPMLLGHLLFGRAPARLALAAAAFLVLFAASGLAAVSAMNNGSVLNLLIVAAALPGLARKRWTAFHTAVTFAAIFKPYYVFFWIVPVLAHGFSWRQTFIAAGLTILAALTYVLPIWLAPEIFQAWVDNMLATLAIGGVGMNVFGALRDWLTGPELRWLPYAAQLAYIGFLGALLLLTRLRGKELWAALLLGAVFMNPRPLGYDLAIAAIPFACLTATLLPRSMGMGWRLILSTCVPAGVMLLLSYNDNIAPAAVVFPLMTAGLLAACSMRAGLRVAIPALRFKPNHDRPSFGGAGQSRREEAGGQVVLRADSRGALRSNPARRLAGADSPAIAPALLESANYAGRARERRGSGR
jgi:hypothetical protein